MQILRILAGILGIAAFGLALYYGVWRVLVNFIHIFTEGEVLRHIGYIVYDIISALLYRWAGIVFTGFAFVKD